MVRFDGLVDAQQNQIPELVPNDAALLAQALDPGRLRAQRGLGQFFAQPVVKHMMFAHQSQKSGPVAVTRAIFVAPQAKGAGVLGIWLDELLAFFRTDGAALGVQRGVVVLHQGVDRIGRDLRLLGQQGRPRQLRAPGGEPGIHGFGGHRPGDGITLKTAARHGGQRQRVLRRAHALGHHGQAHQRGGAQQPVSDAQPGAAGEQVAGEAAVDLDRRDLELLQMGEAGAAGAKVVERDPHAEMAAPADDKAGHAAVELGAMLGDFEHEPFRRTLRMAFQRGTQVGEKLRIEKMARTDVDVDLNLPALQMPALRLIERGRQYETSDRHTDLLVIEHRLEGARRVHAVGVAQAQQRFGAVDANHARSRAAIE